ncbi:hypothetical protein GM921_16615 [Pedobacter sp. LMG 31464]|uniref:Uncharacterized protein n=1 Tax=Pedobacter planticolens TaxID=2679964 RepID=A0A923E427_9SPHI|nr:hypothetical protein [Pedobacter planticolens]MBB2147129.1 hypothetical protein [Pedobacter planticolens]
MKKLFFLLFVVSVCISCKKQTPNSVVLDIQFPILFKDGSGVNLLDPSISGAIKAEDIDIFVLKNGVKTKVYYSNLDRPEMFYITDNSRGPYIMVMSFDISSYANFSGNKITQFVKYKDGTEDEFIGEFNTDRSINILLQRVWVNGVLKWEMGTNQTKPTEPIVIIK